MIYHLLHFFLRWDFIRWRNSCDGGIARIRKDHNGRVYYLRYWITDLTDEVTTPEQVYWLTCPPEKYLGKKP